MGITWSLLARFVPGLKSLPTDKLFDQFFKEPIRTFEDFHIKFLDALAKLNSVLPGEHCKAPTSKEIKEFYEKWRKEEPSKRKESLINFLREHMKPTPTDNAVLMTGLLAPPAAMVLKKAGNTMPQVKAFRLDVIPDVVFVPSMTCLALLGAKFIRLNASQRR